MTTRTGQCIACGRPVVGHFDEHNRKLDCDRATYAYQLPDGTVFRVASDLCKGASTITFELKAVPPAIRGRIVNAIIVKEA